MRICLYIKKAKSAGIYILCTFLKILKGLRFCSIILYFNVSVVSLQLLIIVREEWKEPWVALSNQGEVAYWIGEPYWGRGYATEAAKAILQFAFEEKKLHKVFARYFSTNIASGRVMKKIGMEQEGILKEHIIKEGKYEDLVYYGILNVL